MLAGTALKAWQARKAGASERAAVANMEVAQQKARESEALANFVLDGIG